MENGLKLVLRSHEGPDARFERDDMASMQEGWTTDHVVDAGRLLTVFRHADSLALLSLNKLLSLRGPPSLRPALSKHVDVKGAAVVIKRA